MAWAAATSEKNLIRLKPKTHEREKSADIWRPTISSDKNLSSDIKSADFFVAWLSTCTNFVGRHRWKAAAWLVDSRYTIATCKQRDSRCYFNILTCYCTVWLRLTSINKRIWWWWSKRSLLTEWTDVCVMKLIAMYRRPLYVTLRRPITSGALNSTHSLTYRMNKIRKRQKEQEIMIAAELGNRTIAFTNWMAGSLCFPISFENA